MKTSAHIALILLFSFGLTARFLRSSPLPRRSFDVELQSSQDLPDSPGTQVPVSPAADRANSGFRHLDGTHHLQIVFQGSSGDGG